jgi:hypothetical protein
MSKYLTDKEIMKWNERLKDTPYIAQPYYHTQGSHPHLSIYIRRDIMGKPLSSSGYTTTGGLPSGFGTEINEPCADPKIIFNFSFSVTENRKNNFFDLLEKLQKNKINTKVINPIQSKNDHRIDPIEELSNTDFKIEETTHKLLNKTYIKYSYSFYCRLSTIISTISYLEDTIKFFEKIWGYDENGSEYCLLKYPIGSVISPIKDKSRDYLIIDYLYLNNDFGYKIDYVATEITEASVIIKYGETKRFSDDDICFSRNNRIDNILN